MFDSPIINPIKKRYTLKYITIDELVEKYKYLLIGFGIVLLNLIINNKFKSYINNIEKPKDEIVINTVNCASMYNIVFEKIYFNDTVIKYSLGILGIIFFLYNYLKKIKIEFIFGFGYILSTLLKPNPFMFSNFSIDQCVQESYYFIKFLFLMNIGFDLIIFIIPSFIFVFIILWGLIIFIEYISIRPIKYFKLFIRYINQIYNDKIKNIKIEYYEEKQIDLDKIV